MSLGRTITIDTWNRGNEGACGLLVETRDQAPILYETEGCNSSLSSIIALRDRVASNPRTIRWCIVRLVPVDGNELLCLDFERLQQFNKDIQQ